eukprot:10362169-Ditylum_brightwellii.AAC.2
MDSFAYARGHHLDDTSIGMPQSTSSTYVPNEEGSEKDGDSIPSIDSLQEVPIHHNTDDFEPLTDITGTADNDIVDDDDINSTVEENTPEVEIDGNILTAGANIPEEVEEDEDNGNVFTTGVIVQDDKEASSSYSEELSEEEPAEMAGVQKEEEENLIMENKTLQANINERDVQVNVLPPTNDSNNPQSIKDQIANIEQEMDQAYRTRIHGELRTSKHRTLIPTKFQGFSNTTTATIR